MAQLPRRVNERELSQASRWDIAAVWAQEKERLKRWLDSEVGQRLRENRANARDAVEAVVESVRLSFVDPESSRDSRILIDGATGELQRRAGSRQFVWVIRAFLILALASEVGFFVALYLMGLGNYFLVLQGLLLAVGSFLAGAGVEGLLREREEIVYEEVEKERRRSLAYAIGGGVMVILVLVLRASEGRGVLAIIAFTSALALGSIVLTAYHKAVQDRYETNARKMFSAQRWFASDKHAEACRSGYWRSEYLLKLETVEKDEAKVLELVKGAQ